MTPTEKIRAMLDERGVEWEEGTPYGANAVTRFKVSDVWLRYVDYGDYQWLDYHEDEPLTPEQAIAVTLGAGTCHMELRKNPYRDFLHEYTCSECGESMCKHTFFGKSVPPRWCPNCGRKVD